MRPFENVIPKVAGSESDVDDAARPVVVVDDNLDDKEYLRQQLGFLFGETPVITFFSGNALVSYLQDHPRAQDIPRMILLDLHMAGIDGIRVLEFLRRSDRFSAIPVIVVSGTDDSVKIRAALAAGAQAFLQKPVSRRDIIDVLHGRGDPAHVAH
jgi:CheY-like chemotaxis protein